MKSRKKDDVVLARIVEQLKQLYASDERAIDLHQYSGPLFDVVFEIITADTFVAGVACKIVDGDPVTAEDATLVNSPLLLEIRMWLCDDGRRFDLQPYPEVYRVAMQVDRLRAKCREALGLANNLQDIA